MLIRGADVDVNGRLFIGSTWLTPSQGPAGMAFQVLGVAEDGSPTWREISLGVMSTATMGPRSCGEEVIVLSTSDGERLRFEALAHGPTPEIQAEVDLPPVAFPGGFSCRSAGDFVAFGQQAVPWLAEVGKERGNGTVVPLPELSGCTLRQIGTLSREVLVLVAECRGHTASGEATEGERKEVVVATWNRRESLLTRVLRLKGRHGSVAYREAGAGILVFDSSTEPSHQRIESRYLDGDLRVTGEQVLLDTHVDLVPAEFEVLAVKKDDWVVAGAKDARPWVGLLTWDGRLRDAYWGKDMDIAARYVLAARGETVYLVSSALEFVDCGKPRPCPRQGLRVLRFDVSGG